MIKDIQQQKTVHLSKDAFFQYEKAYYSNPIRFLESNSQVTSADDRNRGAMKLAIDKRGGLSFMSLVSWDNIRTSKQ